MPGKPGMPVGGKPVEADAPAIEPADPAATVAEIQEKFASLAEQMPEKAKFIAEIVAKLDALASGDAQAEEEEPEFRGSVPMESGMHKGAKPMGY